MIEASGSISQPNQALPRETKRAPAQQVGLLSIGLQLCSGPQAARSLRQVLRRPTELTSSLRQLHSTIACRRLTATHICGSSSAGRDAVPQRHWISRLLAARSSCRPGRRPEQAQLPLTPSGGSSSGWRSAVPGRSAHKHALRAVSSNGSAGHSAEGFVEGSDDYFDDDDYFHREALSAYETKLSQLGEDMCADEEQRQQQQQPAADGRRQEAMDRGQDVAAQLATMLKSVPQRTATAVGTTAAGTASMLREARWKAALQALWGQMLWLWNRPTFQRLRFTISMANLSVRLPAVMAIVGTQIGLLTTQVSLPMLAPLLLGTGMMFRSIKANASIIFPRIGLLVVLLWALWFANSVVQNTVMYLRRQGAIDHRVSGAVVNASEVCVLVAAVVILLSMLGLNLSGLLIPAGVALALAAKDLSHNFLAGFFLFAVQPFKLGDRVGVAYSSAAPSLAGGAQGAWFEGVCEKVDLRYTTIKSGRRRLLVPNSAFITREFMVLDDSPTDGGAPNPWDRPKGRQNQQQEDQQQQQQRGAESHDWVRHTVLEEQPFHAANSPNFSRASALDSRPPSSYRNGDDSDGGRPWAAERHQQQRRRRQRRNGSGDYSGSNGGYGPPPPSWAADPEQHMFEHSRYDGTI